MASSTPRDLNVKIKWLSPLDTGPAASKTMPRKLPTYKEGMELAADILVMLDGVTILESIDEDARPMLITVHQQFHQFHTFCKFKSDSLIFTRSLFAKTITNHSKALESSTACKSQLIAHLSECRENFYRLSALSKQLMSTGSILQDFEEYMSDKTRLDLRLRGIEGKKKEVKTAKEFVSLEEKEQAEISEAMERVERQYADLKRQWKKVKAKLGTLKTKIKNQAGLGADEVDVTLDNGDEDGWGDYE